MNRFPFEELLRELAGLRPYFVSERDLQVSLAMLILKRFPELRVLPEYCPAGDPSMHIDLMLFTQEGWQIPVELKYRTRRCNLPAPEGAYTLKEQSARDLGCYLYMKDLERLEHLAACAGDRFLRGFALPENHNAPGRLSGKAPGGVGLSEITPMSGWKGKLPGQTRTGRDSQLPDLSEGFFLPRKNRIKSISRAKYTTMIPATR